jgi:hypothetical protein
MLCGGGDQSLELVRSLSESLVNGGELDRFGAGSQDQQDTPWARITCGDK